jgi:hypothetical protein
VQSHYPPAFDREMGCTEAEWLQWLPGGVGANGLTLEPGTARVALEGGALALSWHALDRRRIALIEMPRLAVRFRFDAGIGDAERARFMRYFDLYMQRGGG